MNSLHEQYNTERLNAISITEVARHLGDHLKREGVSYKTLCPWHADHQPSLSFDVRTGNNYCHCFSCNKGGDVIAYVMQHEGWTFQQACQWLSREFGIGTIPAGMPVLKPRRKPVMQPTEAARSYIPQEMADELVSAENSLCQCLMLVFRHEAVEWMVEEYHIGSYSMYGRDNWTVFPCIDIHNNVCNLKIQWYDTDPQSNMFGHCPKGNSYWLAKTWMKEGKLPAGGNYTTKCLFGEHLLSRYPSTAVVLVESPKNALIGALAYPQWVWIAAGNKGMFKREVLKPLQGRDVMVIPDRDAIGDWTKAAAGMADLANFVVSDFCERIAPKDSLKYDIADYLLAATSPLT